MSDTIAPIEPKPFVALILSGEGYTLIVPPDADTAKAELIKHSALIVEVKDAASAAAASSQLKKLSDMRIAVEKSRTKIKGPVLEVGKDIDSKAKAFVGPIEAEEKRLQGLIGAHAQQVERERQEAARKQQEEIRKQVAAEAEAKRAEEEAAAKQKAAKAAEWADDDVAEKAKEAARLAEAELETKRQEAAKAATAALTTGLVANTAPVAGVSMVPDFEVLDVQAFYAAHPDLVELTVKRAATLDRIKAFMSNHGDQLPTLPGLRVFTAAKVRGR